MSYIVGIVLIFFSPIGLLYYNSMALWRLWLQSGREKQYSASTPRERDPCHASSFFRLR